MQTPLSARRSRPGLALLAWILAASLGVAVPSYAQSNSKASRLYEDALVRYEKKDFEGAVIQLKNAIQIDSNMLPVQLLLGKALMKTAEFPAAEVALSEALRLGVSRAEVVVLLGQAFFAQGKQRQLLELNTFSPAGLPRDIQLKVLLLRASAYSDLGNLDKAYQSIAEARAIDARAPEVWLAEVPMRIRAGQLAEATLAVDKALAIDPEFANAWYQRGSILHVRGDLTGALAAYERCLRKEPEHLDALIAQGGIFIDQARLADATRTVTEIRRLHPDDPRGAYLSALLTEKAGDAAASKAALKNVTDMIDPIPIGFLRYRPQILMLNGLAHFSLGQGEKAKQYLEEFRKSQPNAPVSKLLARIYLSDGNASGAATLLEEYLRARPGDGQAMSLLASANRALGRNAKASALIKEALKAQDNPAYRTALGLSLIGEGQTANAIVELETALKRDPQQYQAASALIQLYLREGHSAKAIPVARDLVKRQASVPEFHNLLGMSLLQNGDVNGARAAYEKALQLNAAFTPATLNLARLETSQKAFDNAAKRLSDLMLREANNSEAIHEMGMVAEQKGALGEAKRWMEKARDVAPAKDLRWGLALAEFHLRHANGGDALDAAKAASGKAPEDFVTLLTYSRAQIAVGDTFGAKNTLTGMTRLAAFDPAKQLELAQLQMVANNPSGAAYSLEKALSARPDFPQAQALMTEVELRMGDIPRAEKRAKEFTQQNPKRAIGYTLQGDIAAVKGQNTAAVEAYRRAHQVEPSTFTVLRLANALARVDGDKSASGFLEGWLNTRPKDFNARKALGDSYARQERFEQAKSAYEAASNVNASDSEVLNNLAVVQLRMKDPAAAVKTAERALTLTPTSAVAADTLGWALFQSGQTDRALALLRDARLRQPGNPEIRYHLAAVLLKMGRNSEAKEELEAALKPGGPQFDGVGDAKKLLISLAK